MNQHHKTVSGVIPHPSVLPKLNRRQFMQVSATALLLAMTPLVNKAPRLMAQATPPPVDEAGPIGKKWVKLGGQSAVGAPTSEIVQTSDGTAQYQTFEKGVIIYSVDWGAMLISAAIFQKWLALNNQANGSGQNLLSYVGFPKQDYVTSPGLEVGYFERGMIVINTIANTSYVVYGLIYEHYWQVRDVVGLPIGEEASAEKGGRYQPFDYGDIYWQSDSGAFEIHGSIRQRWIDLGGVTSVLGYPVSDELPVRQDGNEIGRSSRFENGVIYFSGATGAWEVIGEMRQTYEDQHGGPSTPTGLGFPTSSQGITTSGGVFQNFQSGVVINHAVGPYQGQWIFSKLQLYIQRLQGNGTDCALGICGSQDLYVFIDVTTSTGTEIHMRRPNSGEYDGGSDIQETFELTPNAQVVQSDLVVNIHMDAWDYDDTSPNDHLGTLDLSYSIDNLWGVFDGGEHTVSDDGSFTATLSIKNPIQFDAAQFRQQLWWSFHNFDTPKLTYDQYAATFTDVDTDESVVFHPFNKLYYAFAYNSVAKRGNCFGMSLESIFAQVGRSLYSEPIIRFWPDTQEGRELDPNNPTHQATINEINIKHGYQVGAECIDWFLGKFVSGQDHDPKRCFGDSRDAFNRGDYPILSISPGALSSRGHAVRPYRWDDSDPTKWIIYIANPNNPVAIDRDDAPACRIEIDITTNTFTYQHSPTETWTGSGSGGGRMFYIPFRHLSDQPRTPFWEVLALITGGVLLLLGEGGQTKQIVDGENRSFFAPTLSTPPTQWDEIRQDSEGRIPNFTRVPFYDGATDAIPLEMYYARGNGATYKHEIVASQGSTLPYEWVMHSAALSAHIEIPGTPGVADLITVHDLSLPSKAVAVTIPMGSTNKQISWTMAGPVKHRWVELTNLAMVAEQSIMIRLVNGGYEATFENRGPTTTAVLRIQAGLGAAPVIVGKITLVGEATTSFKFDTPLTTLRFTADTRNSSGWLVGPAVIEMSAKDYSSRGIEVIEFSKDSNLWTAYHIPFLYSDEGITTFYYRSRDKDLNQEGANSQIFKIDTHPPQSILTIGEPQTPGSPPIIETGTPLILTAKDATSGVQSVAYRYFLKGDNPTPYVLTPGDTVQFQIVGPAGDYEVHTFATDIAGNDESPHVQFVHLPYPTAINVEGIAATRGQDGVMIEWETVLEINTIGFHIYRSMDNDRSNAAQVTQYLITAKGHSGGASYLWKDSDAQSEQNYYYWLEEIEQGGASNYYGPITINRPLSSVYLPFVTR